MCTALHCTQQVAHIAQSIALMVVHLRESQVFLLDSAIVTMSRIASTVAAVVTVAVADRPGSGISKITHAASQPIAGKEFMYKYFNVATPKDECANDVCSCTDAPTIEQGRVYAVEQSSSVDPGPGAGFGLHLVSVPGHSTSGGLTVETIEGHFNEKLADMTSFDSFMDFNAVFATSSLASYKSAFDKDGVKYFMGTWSDSSNGQYTSIIVQVPGSQLLLELVQKTALSREDATAPVQMEQRVPDSVLSELSGESVADTTTDYITALVVNRAVSSKAMSELEDFYVTGMGTSMSLDSTENGATKKCFLWPGATVHNCFTNRADSETSTSFTVGDLEDSLNSAHKQIIDGHPWCPMDRWFDNHYAIDSRSVSSTKVLSYINSKNPYHTCGTSPMGGSGLSAIFDPSGLGIQMDTDTGLPNDCNTFEEIPGFLMATLEGGGNPACTVDTSNCGSLSLAVEV